VRYCHESRKRGSPEDRITLRWPVHDFEVEFLPSVILPIPEIDVECYLTKWIVSTPWDYSVKGAISWFQELQ
jgi:hypothetical protein